jgi:hypothetical protein
MLVLEAVPLMEIQTSAQMQVACAGPFILSKKYVAKPGGIVHRLSESTSPQCLPLRMKRQSMLLPGNVKMRQTMMEW